MKKITYILLIVLAGLSISCEKFLDAPEKSTVDNELIFSNPELTEEAIVGILQPMGNVNFRGRYLTHYGGNTDIEWFNSSTSINDRSDLCRYVNSTTNGDMNTLNNVFGEMYVGIERANICIAGIREYGQPEPGNEMGQLLGEALTYRAVYYADLAKSWGDVPARFEPMTESTIYIAKSSRDVIYKQIIADLEEAATLVAWPNETARTTTVEHVNKAFVKGLRARVCLAAAGFSQRASGIKRSSDPDLSVNTLYPIALQECKDVIANGTAQLENTFEGLFRKNCLENTSAGGESLWEIPFADGRGRFLYTFGVKHNKPDQYTGQGQGGLFGPLPNVYYDFDARDTRRDVTCVPYRWGDPSNNIASQELVGLNTWYFGKWRYEWMTRRVTSGNDDGLNKMYMRYAEIILMAAEIENELNGPAAAAPYLTQLRERAFASADHAEKVTAYVASASASKETMFEAIVKEHAFEFCGEMERKMALIRWNLLKIKMDEAKVKMNNLRNQAGEYSDVPSTLYYSYVEDQTDGHAGEITILDIYGLERGEITDMSSSYEYQMDWISPTKITDEKLNSLYTNNPDQNQFWPIWQVFIDNSNGMLDANLLD